MVLEAGYPGTTGFRKVVKVTVLVKKKEGISDKDFIEHYNHRHAQMAAPVLQKHKIISYSLVRPTKPRRISSFGIDCFLADISSGKRSHYHARYSKGSSPAFRL
jgi:hypothetical protein